MILAAEKGVLASQGATTGTWPHRYYQCRLLLPAWFGGNWNWSREIMDRRWHNWNIQQNLFVQSRHIAYKRFLFMKAYVSSTSRIYALNNCKKIRQKFRGEITIYESMVNLVKFLCVFHKTLLFANTICNENELLYWSQNIGGEHWLTDVSDLVIKTAPLTVFKGFSSRYSIEDFYSFFFFSWSTVPFNAILLL